MLRNTRRAPSAQVPNPWISLPSSPPYVASCDVEAVTQIQDRCVKNGPDFERRYGYRTQLLPDPWTGDPFEAPVIVLTANPGFTDEARAEGWKKYGCTASDEWWHSNSKPLQECYRKNLAHEPQEYPLFFLRPELSGTPGGYYYRYKQFRELISEFGEKSVARAFCIVEYAPYHSVDFRDLGALPSQSYTFPLIRQAIERKACIVLLRGSRLFLKGVPELADYSYLRPSSVRSPAISAGNIRGFERVRSAVKEMF
jgi:hypothetical protein